LCHLFVAITVACLLALAGCGANPASDIPAGDFTLAVTPASTTLAPGGAGQALIVTATADGIFNNTINIAISGVPSGVTATPASLTLSPGKSQNVILTAASNASAGQVNVTLTGTSGSLAHTATVSLNVTTPAAPPAPADFSLSLSPTTATITAGSTTGASIAVNASAQNGFTGNVAISLTGLPSGVTASPSTLTLTPGTPQNIKLTAASGATAATSTVTVNATSGSLAHTSAIALTIAAPASVPPPPTPPDFGLSVAPTAQTITDGNANGAQVAVTATALNGFNSSVAVALTGLPAGVSATPATLTLTPGAAQNVTLTAASTAATGNATLSFTGVSGTLTHTATLALTVQPAPPPAIPDVTTYHYDNTREGLNSKETILTTSNVNATTFGKIGFYAADGKVDAQPLFAANVTVSPGVTQNLVYVASEHGSVYAYAQATGQQVWKVTTLAAGETTSDPHNCDQITPEIGITATPVIDRSHGPNGTIFVVAMSKDASGKYHQRLHALDLATGAELSGSPVDIAATFPGTGDNSSNGVVSFDPGQYAERAGLLLLNGAIYLAWTSHCDQRPYTGWVMGYSEALQQTQVLNLTPNGSEGAIWMAGYGMAADSSGNIYLLDANGAFSGNFNANGFPSDNDYGNAMIKLSTNGTLAVADFFQPYDTIHESSVDEDLGSGGAMLLPDLTDKSGVVHHLVLGAGKDDNIYIADRDNMGKINSGGSNNSNVYQELNDALAQGAWSGPAYFNNTVYYGGQGDVLKAFPITNAMLATTPSSKSATRFQYPGTTPAVSANGNSSGIVWAVEDNPSSAAVLHAYDATNLANELYNSNQAAGSRDAFGNGNKFITPVIVDGNVFVGTQTGVAVFGLLSTP
jgi:outer membrane protein assembly factor BamB